MDNAQFNDICAWITEAGLGGQSETATLDGFCERAVALGLPLARVNVVIDTLHPVYEGRAFIWKRDGKETLLSPYGRSTEAIKRWEDSPFFYLEESGARMLRRRLSTETDKEFPVFPELRAGGMTDYLAITDRFAAEGIIGDMDCVYSSWTTDAPEGFRDADVADIGRLTPVLALTLKAASLARIARTLVRTYPVS
jgi:adenylate cyclase